MRTGRALTIAAFAIGAVAACGRRIAVPIEPCIIQGALLTHVTAPEGSNDPTAVEYDGEWFSGSGRASIDKAVQGLLAAANDTTWIPDADIAFFVPPDTVGAGFLPVIPDPMPPGPDASVNGPGDLGDISLDGLASELASAVASCRDRWGIMGTPGTPLLIVRRFVNSSGTPVQEAGESRGPQVILGSSAGTARLCTVPRSLSATDMQDGFSALKEPASFGALAPWTWVFLAHELGHSLLLSHGDGLDNDANGSPLGTSGPRLFDEGCDSAEFRAFDNAPGAPPASLMAPVPPVSHLITPLQRELARDAAIHAPGAIGGPP
jgi:hypothetical protein